MTVIYESTMPQCSGLIKQSKQKTVLLWGLATSRLFIRSTLFRANIQINYETLEQVSTFKYLGQTITQDDKNKFEIKIRMAIAKIKLQQMYLLLTSKEISKMQRQRLLVCYVFSVILYGCEIEFVRSGIWDVLEKSVGNWKWKMKLFYRKHFWIQ